MNTREVPVRRWLFAAALSLPVLPLLATPALADIAFPDGQLLLDLGAADAWRYGDETQSLSTPPGNKNCALLDYPQSGPDQLVTVTSAGGGPGFLDKNGKELLGIVGPGVDCGRINASEWVEVALAGSLAGKQITGVDLRFNLKGNAIVEATAYDDGAGTSHTYTLYSGSSIPPSLGEDEASCAAGSDSSPDNDATNCAWSFPAHGNRLRLAVLNGEAGLGGEGSVSVFEINTLVPATGQIDCEDNSATDVIEFLNAGEGSNAAVQCFRRPNLDGAACEVVDYSLVATCDGGECGITFLHALETVSPPGADQYEFICETWWPEQEATFDAGTGAFVLPKSEQFFGPDELQGDDLDFCEAVTPVYDAGAPACTYLTGGAVGACTLHDIDTVVVPLALDHQPTVPGNQVGCLLDERVRQVEDLDQSTIETLIKHYQMWVLKGDYRVSRAF